MKLPNGEIIMVTDDDGLKHAYDPRKAHEYYLRIRQLKGRNKGAKSAAKSHTGKPKVNSGVRAKQKKELTARIQNLEGKLVKLKALIKKKEHEAKQAARKSTTKKKASAKKAAKPDTAAEKAKKARGSKKYKDKHKQELATKAKAAAKKSGGSSKGKTAAKPKSKGESSLKDLKMLATKVQGQLSMAKAKLRAL